MQEHNEFTQANKIVRSTVKKVFKRWVLWYDVCMYSVTQDNIALQGYLHVVGTILSLT